MYNMQTYFNYLIKYYAVLLNKAFAVLIISTGTKEAKSGGNILLQSATI